jgi:hypothetical protein
MSAIWPFRRRDQGAGFYVESRFRFSFEATYRLMERKWYPWRWLANSAARPQYFSARLSSDPDDFGIILSKVVPASVDTLPKGRDSLPGLVRSKGSAVAESETPKHSVGEVTHTPIGDER